MLPAVYRAESAFSSFGSWQRPPWLIPGLIAPSLHDGDRRSIRTKDGEEEHRR